MGGVSGVSELIIHAKRSRDRRPPQPRTCCPTHNDRCDFGRPHVWCIGNYLDGEWLPNSTICGACGARCVDEEVEAQVT